MEWLVGVLVAIGAIAGAWWLLRRVTPPPSPPRPGSWDEPDVDREVIVLDLDVTDPDDPSVQRLVQQVARQALVAHERVEVRSRADVVLARLERAPAVQPEPTLPDTLHEPQLAQRHRPQPITQEEPPVLVLGDEGQAQVGDRPFADRFELPPEVRRRITDPHRPLDVVAAILEAAGRPVERQEDVITTDGTALTVVEPTGSRADAALTHGFMAIRAVGATRGVVIRLGYVDPAAVRRREAAAPHVRHVTADAVQRMADAVALGGDPLAFVVGPATVR